MFKCFKQTRKNTCFNFVLLRWAYQYYSNYNNLIKEQSCSTPKAIFAASLVQQLIDRFQDQSKSNPVKSPKVFSNIQLKRP